MSSSQVPVFRLKSSVREALLGSVACTRPPVNCHSNQLSTVPKANSPRSARNRAPGTWSSNHASLVPEKYESSTKPVLAAIPGAWPAARRASQNPLVRRSCQTMAGATGSPVWRSHSTVVSRWLVMPRARTWLAVMPACTSTSRRTANWVCQISLASCSTHPGCGKCWVNSRCAMATTRPPWSNTTARELVVPWSIESM